MCVTAGQVFTHWAHPCDQHPGQETEHPITSGFPGSPQCKPAPASHSASEFSLASYFPRVRSYRASPLSSFLSSSIYAGEGGPRCGVTCESVPSIFIPWPGVCVYPSAAGTAKDQQCVVSALGPNRLCCWECSSLCFCPKSVSA